MEKSKVLMNFHYLRLGQEGGAARDVRDEDEDAGDDGTANRGPLGILVWIKCKHVDCW